MFGWKSKYAACVLLAVALLAVAGCDNSKPEAKKEPEKPPQPVAKPTTQPLVNIQQAMDWCREHAMPESICAQCNEKVMADLKAKGDWCNEHKVPESQCFKCKPQLKETFAAAFQAKYGKEPPAVEPEK